MHVSSQYSALIRWDKLKQIRNTDETVCILIIEKENIAPVQSSQFSACWDILT